MLKRRPTLAHLTGIDEGRLDSFADYLRTAIFSKASNAALSQMSNHPTQLVPSLESDEDSSTKSPTLPFRRSLLKLATFPIFSTPTDPVISQPNIESSMERLQRCMQEIDTSVCSDGPKSSISSSLPAIAKLIESLKRLRNCLHSLSDKRSLKALTLDTSLPSSSQLENSDSIIPSSETGLHLVKFITEPLILRNVLSASRFSASNKYLPTGFSSPVMTQLPVKIPTLSEFSGLYNPCPGSGTIGDVNAQQALASTTLVNYRDLGSTLDPAWSLQAHPVQLYRPSVTRKFFDFSRLLVCPSDNGILSDLFTQLVSQIPLMVSHLSNETHCTHNLYVLPFVLRNEAGASSLPYLSVLPLVLDHLRREKFFHLPACSGYGVPCLWKSDLPMSYAPDQSMSRRRSGGPYPVENDLDIHPGDISRESGGKPRNTEFCHDRRARNSIAAPCGTPCRRCATGTGLGNLVLVNFYAQQI